MRRIALIIPLSQEGRVLLQHKDKEAPNNPDMWCLFGGQVEAGEAPESAARREFLEELGVKVDSIAFFRETLDETKGIERHYFSGSVSEDAATLKKQQKEGDDLGFFNLQEMRNLHMNQAHLEVIADFLT